jgi:putative PIN family toxin of toxin-antitoxin system
VRRAVLDPGVLVSALIAPAGTPARLLEQARLGTFEIVASALLLAELEGVLARDKFRRYFGLDVVGHYVARLRSDAFIAADPTEPAPLTSPDPADDYLITLAFSQNAHLVSGDSDLLDLVGGSPILAPADLLQALTASSPP